MSELDDLLSQISDGNINGNTVIACYAEIADLRDSLNAWSALWAHICQRLNADAETLPNESSFDAMIAAMQAARRE